MGLAGDCIEGDALVEGGMVVRKEQMSVRLSLFLLLPPYWSISISPRHTYFALRMGEHFLPCSSGKELRHYSTTHSLS